MVTRVVKLLAFGAEFFHLLEYGGVCGWIGLQDLVDLRHVRRTVRSEKWSAEQGGGKENGNSAHVGPPFRFDR
ncbi:hypothetical protein D3C76_1737080 [compost metagenome]